MSYRGMDNSSFRNQNMSRPKGRPPFKPNCDPMQPVGRARYMQPTMQMATQQPQYPPTAGYQRNNQYSPEYATVQYTQQVPGPPGWNQSIPITMAETYHVSSQHPYPPQQQVYNPETAHMIAIPSNTYIPQVQNQNDFDPLANVSICPKCAFVNSLALLKMKTLADDNKRLLEQLSAMERQLGHTNYEDGGSSPAPQTSMQVSSLSVDAQPFQMGVTPEPKPHQGTNAAADSAADGPTNRSHNGNEYVSTRPGRNWSQYDTPTPVVSASDVTNDRYNEPTSDTDWNASEYSHTDNVKSEPSDRPALDCPVKTEPPNVSANCDWEKSDTVPSTSGPFAISSDKREEDNTEREQTNSAPQNEERSMPKDDRNANETQKNRPRDQRQKPNRARGGRNDSHDSNRDGEGGRKNWNRRESGGSNAGLHHRNSSPQDPKDRRAEKSVSGSRDSSQSCPKSGPENLDKKETDSAECLAKNFDSGDRSPSEKRVDSVDRNYTHGKHLDSGDRFNTRRGGRRYNDQGAKAKGSEEINWRQGRDQGRDQDVNDKRDDRRENFSRPGNRGRGGGFRRGPGANTFKAVVEKDGDLFTTPDDYSLAHCVAEDLRMGSGIAVNFRQKFKQVDELMDQKKRVGQVAVLEEKGRFIYYLITKKRSSGKPSWNDFVAAVEELARLCVEKGVKNLAMPRIGCGLDRLEWHEVKQLLEDCFGDTGITVTAYNFQQNEEPESPMSKAKSTLYFVHERKNLVDIYAETGLIFLCSEENAPTNGTIDSLDKKHKFAYDLRTAKRTVGDVIPIQKGREYLYGLVVKKCERDPLSYVNLGKCLRKMRNTNSKDKYGYFGIEAFRDDKDVLTMEKVFTIIRNVFGGVPYKLEFYVCWPKELENDHLWGDDQLATPSSK